MCVISNDILIMHSVTMMSIHKHPVSLVRCYLEKLAPALGRPSPHARAQAHAFSLGFVNATQDPHANHMRSFKTSRGANFRVTCKKLSFQIHQGRRKNQHAKIGCTNLNQVSVTEQIFNTAVPHSNSK